MTVTLWIYGGNFSYSTEDGNYCRDIDGKHKGTAEVMTAQGELDPRLLVQPIEPGSGIPSGMHTDGLFLLNFAPVLRDDLWDDYGNKELDQARRLRELAARVVAIADALEQLGYEMKAYPSPEDYDFNEYKLSWEELCEEMNSTFTNGYAQIGDLVDDFAEAARGDFMD